MDGQPAGEWLGGDEAGNWVHPASGLKFKVQQTPRGRGIEHVAFLENTGSGDSPLLDNLDFFRWSGSCDVLVPPVILHCGGGLTDATYPGNAWRVRRTELPDWSALHLGSVRGRSSAKDLPLFFLTDMEERSGLAFVVGYSGNWKARIMREENSEGVRVDIGLPLAFRIPAGEQVRLGSVLLVPYEGNLSAGTNVLRNTLRENICPPLPGDGTARSVFVSWFGIQHEGNEAVFSRELECYRAVGTSVFEIDAAWSKQGLHKDYGAGNWLREDQEKFPGGLAPFANKVRSAGMDFGLWIEPETVEAGTILHQELGDYLLDDGNGKRFLLDLSKREALDRIFAVLEEVFEKYGVRWTRFDSNLEPEPFWNTISDPGLRGWTELRHFQGVYELLDRLMARFPDLHLESCSSGGMRIDLEILRRSHSIWISDNTSFPATMRQHIGGANRFLPSHLLHVELVGDYSLVRNGFFDPDDASSFPPEHYLIGFGGLLGFGQPLAGCTAATRAKFAAILKSWNEVRMNLQGDFFALTPQPETLAAWEVWQFVAADRSSAHVIAFRRLSDSPIRTIHPCGLLPGGRYRVTGKISGTCFEADGENLMAMGFPCELTEKGNAELFLIETASR